MAMDSDETWRKIQQLVPDPYDPKWDSIWKQLYPIRVIKPGEPVPGGPWDERPYGEGPSISVIGRLVLPGDPEYDVGNLFGQRDKLKETKKGAANTEAMDDAPEEATGEPIGALPAEQLVGSEPVGTQSDAVSSQVMEPPVQPADVKPGADRDAIPQKRSATDYVVTEETLVPESADPVAMEPEDLDITLEEIDAGANILDLSRELEGVKLEPLEIDEQLLRLAPPPPVLSQETISSIAPPADLGHAFASGDSADFHMKEEKFIPGEMKENDDKTMGITRLRSAKKGHRETGAGKRVMKTPKKKNRTNRHAWLDCAYQCARGPFRQDRIQAHYRNICTKSPQASTRVQPKCLGKNYMEAYDAGSFTNRRYKRGDSDKK